MKPSVKNVTSNQPKTLSKRDAKKSVTRKTQGVLFFQIGLVVSLLASIFAMELQVGSSSNFKITKDNFIEEPPMVTYVIEKPKVLSQPIAKAETPKPLARPQVIIDIIKVIDNSTQVVEKPVSTVVVPVTVTTPVVPVKIETPVVKNTTHNINQVEFAPVFPGCESLKTNEEKKVCMSSKIGAFINKKFKSDRFTGLKKNDVHNIYVQFKINQNGIVQDVIARAPNKQMEKEGVRVLNKLPKMTPGKMGKHNVSVHYVVPISFKVE